MAKRNVNKWYRHGSWWRRLWFNRKYKDVLFRHLFREKQDLLELSVIERIIADQIRE